MDIVESQIERNGVERSGEELFRNFIQTDIGTKINDYIYSVVAEVRQREGIAIFLSRKGYWLYRVFRKYVPWREDFNSIGIYSDRFVAKWFKEDWNGRTIFIVDDTVTSGSTMFAVYQKIKRQYPESDVITVAMFSLATKSELKQNYLARFREEQKERAGEEYQAFLNSMIFGEVSLSKKLGWLSYNQIALFQQLLTPYVIDLPLMNLEEGTVISSEVFERLREIKNGWQYIDNSYKLCDIDIADGNVEYVNAGFFRSTIAFFLQNLEKYVFQMVVKCHYKYASENGIEIIFTPFAVLKSIDWVEAKAICLKLYAGTLFGNWLSTELKDKPENVNGEMKHGVLVYRAVVYFFSMYGGQLFKEKLKTDYNIDIQFNLELLKENSEPVFEKTIEKIKGEWCEKDYRDRIYASGMVAPACELLEYAEEVRSGAEAERDVYFRMYQEVIRRKRAGNKTDINSGFVSLEDLSRSVEEVVPELPKAARMKLFMKALLQMLDKSILGNRLICKNMCILRGFRFGENSDIAIPFYNVYIYGGVLELYSRYKRIYSHDILTKKFPEAIKLLMRGIETKARCNGYFNLLVSEWELQCNLWYFSDQSGDFSSLVENKSFRLEGRHRNMAVVEDILSCVDEIVRD